MRGEQLPEPQRRYRFLVRGGGGAGQSRGFAATWLHVMCGAAGPAPSVVPPKRPAGLQGQPAAMICAPAAAARAASNSAPPRRSSVMIVPQQAPHTHFPRTPPRQVALALGGHSPSMDTLAVAAALAARGHHVSVVVPQVPPGALG